MNITMDGALADAYTNKSQKARVTTEAWAAQECYCVACDSPTLTTLPNNRKASDFNCPRCQAFYQLKGMAKWNTHRIPDGEYHTMIAAVTSDQVPNLLLMQYTSDWRVREMMIVPSFMFSASVIERRNPLSPTARRAGWTGCNILLSAIPADAKIAVISDYTPTDTQIVRAAYRKIAPLKSLHGDARGWTLDVLQVIDTLSSTVFTLEQVYRHTAALQAKYPENKHVPDKIRQQLQVLRDKGIIAFLGNGRYQKL